jgi:hypothetical protein
MPSRIVTVSYYRLTIRVIIVIEAKLLQFFIVIIVAVLFNNVFMLKYSIYALSRVGILLLEVIKRVSFDSNDFDYFFS